MTRAALTLPALSHHLVALLLSAAGFSAFAQGSDAPAAAAEQSASANEAAAAPTPAEAKPRLRPKPIAPSALSAPPATWSGLTPKQQALLAPLERDWPEISDTQRSKWLSATPTLATMSGEEIKRVHDRIRDWTLLSGSERLNARIGFQVTRQLTPEQRQARWEAYQALPEEARKALAEKAMARRQALAEAPARAAKPVPPKASDAPKAPRPLVAPALVTSTLVQAKPGATTVLITRDLTQPRPIVAPPKTADPRLLDPHTLLPLKNAPPASTPQP